jgi:hypothetical protein
VLPKGLYILLTLDDKDYWCFQHFRQSEQDLPRAFLPNPSTMSVRPSLFEVLGPVTNDLIEKLAVFVRGAAPCLPLGSEGCYARFG